MYGAHVHSSPGPVERKLDDFELVRQARERGMAGLVLENHCFTTTLRARLAASQVPGSGVVASIALSEAEVRQMVSANARGLPEI